MSEQTDREKRRGIRFDPGDDNLARIDPQFSSQEFFPQINALVLDEAKDGYRLVTVNTDRIKVGQVCRVKVGKFPPIEAEVVWVDNDDPQLLKFGLQIIK